MTTTTEHRISHDELFRVAFACHNCGAEIVLDLKDSLQRERMARQELAGSQCEVCGVTRHEDIKPVLSAIARWFARAEEAKQPVWFSLRRSDESEPHK